MTKSRKSVGSMWLGAVAAGLLMAACGTNEVEGSAVTGVALSDTPVAGTVELVDSSAQPLLRQVTTRPDGSFSVDVAGLTPPYLLRVAFSEAAVQKRLYAVSEGNENLDVNPITDVAFGAASSGRDEDEVFERSDREQKRSAADRARSLLIQLQAVLAPLFERYGIADPRTDKQAVRELLEDVQVRRSGGVVTVTNRETGGVIFTGALDDLASGTFDPDAMPEGPGTTPPPAGTDGAQLYANACAACHGPLATSQVRGESASSIAEAIQENEGGMGTAALRALTSTQLGAIATALRGGTTPPPACTYTYGAWTACAAGTQSRVVLQATPAGCAGTPLLVQSCGTTPPPPDGAALYQQHCASCHGSSMLGSSAGSIQSAIDRNTGGMGSASLRALTPAQVAAIAATGNPAPATCSAFSYSSWGACQTNGTQVRTVTGATPAGCTGGSPVTTQACTPPPPPPATCSAFSYSAWGACQTNGTQARTVTGATPAGCTGGSPVTTQACTPPPPPPTTCSAFSYSAWGACQPNGTQARTVTGATPAGCTGGSPATTQACTYTAPLDGAALYSQHCAGCHGNSQKGASVSSIQNAINSNRGGMGSASLRALTTAQLQAISAAP